MVILFFFSKKIPFIDLFDLDFGAGYQVKNLTNKNISQLTNPVWIGSLALIIAIPASIYFSEREDLVPDRNDFFDFPLQYSGWEGRLKALDADVLDKLKLTDYLIGDFSKENETHPVNFYVAWYEEQRKGASIHSPKSCLPGGGWQIKSHTIKGLSLSDNKNKLYVNRVNMKMGNHNQLVYYWFEGRGRNITNEYLAKWYIFWDSLTRSRTDGALVRLVTYVPDGVDINEADNRLFGFINEFYPLLSDYVPE